MASRPRCSSSSSLLTWLLFLVLVVLVDAVAATSRPLGIAEPPTTAERGTAAGPVGASSSRPRGGGGRPDRSVAGAEAILAGFAAAVMVTIFCYIRVTRRNSSSDVGLGLGGKQQG